MFIQKVVPAGTCEELGKVKKERRKCIPRLLLFESYCRSYDAWCKLAVKASPLKVEDPEEFMQKLLSPCLRVVLGAI